MGKLTTIGLTRETKARLEGYKDYPEQSFDRLVIACLDYMDKMATKEHNNQL